MPVVLLTIIWILCAVWVVTDVYQRTDKTSEMKVVWIVLSVIPQIGIITALVYYLLEKKDKVNNN